MPPDDLISCAGCGVEVPARETRYVDGAGQLCAVCAPPWDFITITEPPF